MTDRQGPPCMSCGDSRAEPPPPGCKDRKNHPKTGVCGFLTIYPIQDFGDGTEPLVRKGKGAWTPLSFHAVDKRFHDAELAALWEYFSKSNALEADKVFRIGTREHEG